MWLLNLSQTAKYSLILIVIIGGLVAFLVINKRKPRNIESTVVSVKEINEIGELITAEYYGEVISGLSMIFSENYDEYLETGFQQLTEEITQIDSTFTARFQPKLEKVEAKSPKERRIKRRMERKKLKQLRKSGAIESKAAFKEFKKALKLNNRELLSTLNTAAEDGWVEFKNDHLEEINTFKEKQKKREEGNKELVYLGRGTVKAGYDLTEIENDNILFSPGGDTIYIMDLDPKLITVDINPWFHFPENDSSLEMSTLYGFTVISSRKENKISLDEITKVKSKCKELLRQDALDRRIFDLAQQYAEETLEGFFSLLSLAEGQEVKKVFISHSKYFYDKSDILYDQAVDSTELNWIKELVNTDTTLLDDEIYGFADKAYQLRLLDQFIIDVYEECAGRTNAKEWPAWAQQYFTNRNIEIEDYYAL